MSKELIDENKRQEFLRYHRANKWIWEAYRDEAFKLGFEYKHFGSQQVFANIRANITAYKEDGQYKVNNNWSGYYARALIKAFPIMANYLEIRPLKEAL